MQDSTGLKLAGFSGTVKISDTTPATVSTKSLTQTSMALATATTYTITYSTMNAHTAGGSFTITAPSTVTLPSSLSTCNVVYSGTTYTMDACSISGSVIYVKGSTFTPAIAKGDSISIVLSLITNPIT
jgi:hypothetical protein